MCKFNDYAVEPENLTFFTGMYSNTYPRLDHYWRELSYDTANVIGSSASGWFTLPQPLSYYNPTLSAGGANLDLLVADCTAAADATVNFASYKDGGINMMFNADFDFGWAWGGGHYMTLDGVTQTWRTTWEPPWAFADISVIQHEMGHGFGLPHSSGAYGATYDNVWDVMSQDRYNCAAATDATYGCIAQHTISYHKDKLGWIPPAQKFTAAVGSTTTITLERLALPATSNYKMAQIPIGGSSTFFYTVEARQLNGYDSKLPGAAVIIHEVDTTRLVPAQVVDSI
jgi:M6 family metalloprotease-like protein